MPQDPVRRTLMILACLAADPRLGGALLIDADPALLEPLAAWMAGQLDAQAPHPIVNVGALRSIEDLWCQTIVTDGTFVVRPGVVVEETGLAPIMLIPDLARLRPMAARTAVLLVGADAAAAEVGDETVRWRPRARWLAAVRSGEAGRLSPHLLDRFMLRVDASGLHQALMPGEWLAAQLSVADLTAGVRDTLAARTPAEIPASVADLRLPPMSADAAERVVSLVEPGRPRRELALARVARVLAAWARAQQVTASHVDEAAELLGHRRGEQQEPAESMPASSETTAPPPAPATDGGDLVTTDEIRRESAPLTRGEAEPAQPVPDSPLIAVTAAALLYPEDATTEIPGYDLADGRHLRPRPGARRSQAHAIGSLPTSDTSDLAVLATVLEAAKFQRQRRKNNRQSPGRFLIVPSDLRRPRYLSDRGDALVMVLDNTCWQGWDRSAALAPYLRRALEREATISIVEFGFKGAKSEFAAERYRAPSLRDPKVLTSLNRSPGAASPLAHALDLALSDLRRRIRRGAAAEQQCVLVVATDARGNVPLYSSLLGTSPAGEVGRTGITDSQRIAAQIGALADVEVVVICPEIGPYHELPFDLAEGLGGAQVQLAPSAGGW